MPRRSAKDTAADLEDGADLAGGGNSNTVAAGQLRALIERVERLLEEKQTIADDIKEVYAEAKGTGFDTRTMRELIKLRKQDQAERQERESILDLYKSALGDGVMLKDPNFSYETRDVDNRTADLSLIGKKIRHTGNGKTYLIIAIVWLGATDEWGFLHIAPEGVWCCRPMSHLNGQRDNGMQRYVFEE